MTPRLPVQAWVTARATTAVVAALEAAGGLGAARFVGGCVRDALLDRIDPPDGRDLDIDVATPLEPPAVIAALEQAGLRAIPTGLAHGVVTARAHGRNLEVASLRRDVATDGRRAVVAFTRDWREDARRRDFTMNALYAEPDGRLHDPTGAGIADALAGRVVFVGDARARVAEDHLRSLRFFRFTAWFARAPADAAALAACTASLDGLATLSGERVAQELLKLLAAPDPRAALGLMQTAGVLEALLPGAEPARAAALIALDLAQSAPADAELRLAALLPRAPAARAALIRRLRAPTAARRRLLAVTEPPTPSAEWDARAIRAAVHRSGGAAVRDRLRLAQALDPKAPAWPTLAAVAAADLPRFPIVAADLLALGARPGPALGSALARLEVDWALSDFEADRPSLLGRARTYLQEV